jgi:hypothetical protein
LLPNALKRTFGSKATALYGFFGSFTAMCSIINVFLYKWLIPENEKSYNSFYTFNGLMSLIALVLLVFVFEDKPYTPKCFRVK